MIKRIKDINIVSTKNLWSLIIQTQQQLNGRFHITTHTQANTKNNPMVSQTEPNTSQNPKQIVSGPVWVSSGTLLQIKGAPEGDKNTKHLIKSISYTILTSTKLWRSDT